MVWLAGAGSNSAPSRDALPLPDLYSGVNARVIEGSYVRDLLAQPEVLRQLLAHLATRTLEAEVVSGLHHRRFRRVVLTGMGSSWHALYPLHLRLNEAGVASSWIEASELLLGFAPLRSSDTLVVMVSQSGESAEIVRLLEQRGEFGHIIGVTNQADSRLGRLAGTTLLLHAGPEATVSCKTYVATLAVLHWLGSVLTGAGPSGAILEIEAATRGVTTYLEHWRSHVATLEPLVAGVQSVFVTGRSVSLATAGTGGLILKESTRQPSEGMSCAAFRHGPLEMVSERVLVLVCAGDARTAALHQKLADDIRRAGGRVGLLSSDAGNPEVFRLPAVIPALLPLVEILPVQMLSLAMAARDGREAGHFERATKITTAE